MPTRLAQNVTNWNVEDDSKMTFDSSSSSCESKRVAMIDSTSNFRELINFFTSLSHIKVFNVEAIKVFIEFQGIALEYFFFFLLWNLKFDDISGDIRMLQSRRISDVLLE